MCLQQLSRPNVWWWGDVGELDTTVAHKDLTVQLGRQTSGRHLQNKRTVFYARALSGAVEPPGGGSDPYQDFSEEVTIELEVTRGRQRGAAFRDRGHCEVG